MKEITKLTIFDFDGTLVNTPEPEFGKPEWERVTGQKWPSRGWWSNPESLNLEVFTPPLNGWVFEQFKKECSDKNTLVFIVTGRILKLENEVKSVLSSLGIHKRESSGQLGYDKIYCNTGGETFRFKCRLFQALINKYEGVQSLTMYDDRETHLLEFINWAKEQNVKINIFDSIKQKQIF